MSNPRPRIGDGHNPTATVRAVRRPKAEDPLGTSPASIPDRSPSPDLRVGRRIATLAVTETISWGVLYYSFSVLLIPMEADGVGGRGELSAAFAVAIVVRALIQPAAGAWVDRYGVRGLMTVGSLGGVALTFAWSAVTSVTGLTIVFAGIGVVTAMVLYEPAFAAAAKWLDGHDRTRAILWMTIVAGFASTIFLPLAATLTEAMGWRDALRVLGVILAIGTVVPHAVMLTEPGSRIARRTRSPETDGPSRAGGGPQLASGNEPTRHDLAEDGPTRDGPERDSTAKQALRDPVFWWLVMAFVCSRGPIVGVMTHLPALLVDRGETATIAAAITGSIGVLSVIGRVGLTMASRRVSMHRLLIWIFVAQAIAFVMIVVAPTRPAIAVFVLVFGIGFGATTIAKPVMVAERFGRRAFGAIAGVVATVVTISEALSPTIVGIARDVGGSYDTSLIVLSGVLVLGAFAAQRYRPRTA